MPLTIHGVRYIDGGFSDNLPELDAETVTISPFSGEADICPTDNTAGLITVWQNGDYNGGIKREIKGGGYYGETKQEVKEGVITVKQNGNY